MEQIANHLGDYIPIQETKIFGDKIPTLPPGKSYRGVFDSMVSRESSGLPDTYTVTVEYKGVVGRKDPYKDTSVVDFGLTRNLLKSTGTETNEG